VADKTFGWWPWVLVAAAVFLAARHPQLAWLLAGALALFLGYRLAALHFAATSPAAAPAPEPLRPARDREQRPQQGGCCWRAPGSGSADRLGELLYVGHGLASVAGDGPEPALIDPGLPVDARIRECGLARLDYWPSYATCSPQARGAYQSWLAGGRRDPRADIGYVFLHFYGLERRALWDVRGDPAAAAERPAIIAELTRLLSIYGENASFRGYAGTLRDLLIALDLPQRSYLEQPRAHPGQPLTYVERVTLGQCAADGAPLPAAWAYQWVLHHAGAASGQVAQRCPGELQALFSEIYRAREAQGRVLPQRRGTLSLEYRPASPSFREEIRLCVPVPDVLRQESVLEELAAMAAEAHDRLAPYSRAVGKHSSGSAGGLLALPVSLWPPGARAQLLALADEVARAPAALRVPVSRLQAALPAAVALTPPTHRTLCELLAGMGLGMEPDPRFGGRAPAREAHVTLFSDDPQCAAVEPSAPYPGMAALLQLAAGVAGAGAERGPAAQAVMRAQIGAAAGLTESERRRLRALLCQVGPGLPKTAGLRRRLEGLDADQREAAGNFLVSVARADGKLVAGQISALQSSFALLGLAPEGVFARLHAADVAGEGRPPAPVRPTRSSQLPTPDVALDAAKVARLQQDSEVAASLLQGVFAEDALEVVCPAAVPAAAGEESEGLPGLDPPAARFLSVLLGKDAWSRAALADAARGHGLPLDGVLERLNEAAYEQLDMPLFEDGDPLLLNPEAVAALGAGRDSQGSD
jgi:hypothetical protein